MLPHKKAFIVNHNTFHAYSSSKIDHHEIGASILCGCSLVGPASDVTPPSPTTFDDSFEADTVATWPSCGSDGSYGGGDHTAGEKTTFVKLIALTSLFN